MKGIRAAVLALGGAFLLAGCGGESGVLAPIPAEGFSQGVYDALEENWTAWEAVDELERMLSSTLPGHCAQEFDSWAQCADFLGPSIPDPAADCGWLEEATYAGMPLEASDAPRVKAEWYGTREGQVEWVSVQSGWRDGAVRDPGRGHALGQGLGDRAGAAGLSGGGGGGDAGGDRRERGELVLRPGGARPRQRALYHPRGGGVWDGGAGADVSGSGAGDLAFGPERGKNI